MKRYKVTWLLPAVAILLAFSAQCRAENSDGYGASFPAKLGHGFANMTMGMMELPKNVINISEDSNVLVGITWGTLRGAWHGVSRTLGGVADMLTSPFATADYVSPGYPWERFSEDTRYFGSAYPGYWTSFGNVGTMDHLGTDEGDELRME